MVCIRLKHDILPTVCSPAKALHKSYIMITITTERLRADPRTEQVSLSDELVAHIADHYRENACGNRERQNICVEVIRYSNLLRSAWIEGYNNRDPPGSIITVQTLISPHTAFPNQHQIRMIKRFFATSLEQEYSLLGHGSRKEFAKEKSAGELSTRYRSNSKKMAAEQRFR